MTVEEIINYIQERIGECEEEHKKYMSGWGGDWQNHDDRASELEDLIQWIKEG